jgi:hypothetical protein
MRGLFHDAGSEAEFVKDKHAVGTDLHTGSDLVKDRRLLVNLDLEATLDEGKRCRQPAYAAAGYDNFGFSGIFHSLLRFLMDAGQHRRQKQSTWAFGSREKAPESLVQAIPK